jgi:acyl-coenzyme A thioesterase PaaI-like protein
VTDAATLEQIKTSMPAAVPLVATMGIEYLEVTETSAHLRLADQDALHNHVGGLHAGAMFTLGESASGAVVLGAFSDLLDRATPLAAAADITYLKLALGDIDARATMHGDPAQIRAELERGGLPKFEVTIELSDAAGTVTARMTVRWALKPHRT